MNTDENKAITKQHCKRCPHSWWPRKAGELPLTCPKCHSSYWRRDRIRPKKEKVVVETTQLANGLGSNID